MISDDDNGHPIFYILYNGRIIFWDGLAHVIHDTWKGLTLQLRTHGGELVRELHPGPFDVMPPIQVRKDANWGIPRGGVHRLN